MLFVACVLQPADARNAYHVLERAISGRLDGLKAELRLITSIKELLDGELSTSTLQRDILQRDLCTVQEQHEALKAAYDALSYETARQASQSSSSTADLQAQQDLLRSANETNKALLDELQEAQANLKQLEKWPAMLAALEERLNTAVQDKTRAEAVSVSAKEEVTHYKKLTETLKQKLRDLGGATADNKEFLDTFEEVMKEEMMTMKAAFETKLRLAREEADATSKRHQQEIVRMQATSPYVALNRAAGLVGSAANLAGKK
jgi:chromosome segregation ATPase